MAITIYYLDACTPGFMKHLQQLSQSNKRSLVDAKTRIILEAYLLLIACADPEGGGGGAERPDTPPPEKSQNYRVCMQYWSGNQASIQCWAINGVSLASR